MRLWDLTWGETFGIAQKFPLKNAEMGNALGFRTQEKEIHILKCNWDHPLLGEGVYVFEAIILEAKQKESNILGKDISLCYEVN